MTQEEKELLLKDLCARLPYGVILDVDTTDWKAPQGHIKVKIEGVGILFKDMSLIVNGSYYGNKYKPYLRPLSDMTEEEKKELKKLFGEVYDGSDFEIDDSGNILEKNFGSSIGGSIYIDLSLSVSWISWLISHHFDLYGLIEKGLAIEAPKEMY